MFDTPTGTLDGSGKKQIIIVSWMGKKSLPFPGFPGSGIGKVWSSSADNNVCKDPDDKIVINQCVARKSIFLTLHGVHGPGYCFDGP